MNQSRMKTESQAAQRHLEAASNLLLATSPHTSAFLSSQRQHLKTATTKEYPQPNTSSCNACGQIFLPGWSCTVTRKTVGRLKKTKAKGVKKHIIEPATHIQYECNLCHTTTSLGIHSKPPPPKKLKPQQTASMVKKGDSTATTKDKPSEPSSTISTPATTSGTTTPTERNATEKKRNRKQKQGGLQALLAKSKAQSASPAGFDLMDFMKTG